MTKFGNRWTGIEKSSKLAGATAAFVVDGSPEYAAEAIDSSITRMQGIIPDVWIVHRIDKSVCVSLQEDVGRRGVDVRFAVRSKTPYTRWRRRGRRARPSTSVFQRYISHSCYASWKVS